MRGKKAKQLRVDRTAEREAARRKERQQTIFTAIVIAIVVAIGGVLVAVSLREPTPEELAAASEGPSDAASDPALENRPVACGAEKPADAGTPKETFSEPEQVLEDGKDYQAVIETSCGTITADLYEGRAPETVNSFVFLAQQGFFDGLEIFRNATSIGALQTGAGTNEASFKIGYTLPDELEAAEEDGYPPGTLAMANAGPNTGGSQFFFVYNDKFTLEPQYAVFGKTSGKGLKTLGQLGEIPTVAPDDPSNETPSEVAYIESVKITTK